MFLNALIVYLLKKHRKTRIVTFWFIYCLSISDVMVGLTGLIYHSLLLDALLYPEKASWNINAIFNGIYRYYLLTSLILILILAVDRCIHMSYPRKYSMMMTRFRARIILVFNIVFGILVDLAYLLTSSSMLIWLQFTLYTLYILGIFAIFAIYLVLYCLIKRQVNATQASEVDHATVHDSTTNGARRSDECPGEDWPLSSDCIPIKHSNSVERNEQYNILDQQENCIFETFQISKQLNRNLRKLSKAKNECQCKLSNKDSCNKCTYMKLNRAIAPPAGLDVLMETHTVMQHDDNSEGQGEIFILPYSTYTDSRKCGKSNDMVSFEGNTSNASSSKTLSVTKKRAKNQRILGTRKLIMEPKIGSRINQVSLRRRSTPDEEVKKATLLILLSVLICYAPDIIDVFHHFIKGAPVVALQFTSHLSVLLSSSLNAVILIVCSKDIRRKLKALFVQR